MGNRDIIRKIIELLMVKPPKKYNKIHHWFLMKLLSLKLKSMAYKLIKRWEQER